MKMMVLYTYISTSCVQVHVQFETVASHHHYTISSQHHCTITSYYIHQHIPVHAYCSAFKHLPCFAIVCGIVLEMALKVKQQIMKVPPCDLHHPSPLPPCMQTHMCPSIHASTPSIHASMLAPIHLALPGACFCCHQRAVEGFHHRHLGRGHHICTHPPSNPCIHAHMHTLIHAYRCSVIFAHTLTSMHTCLLAYMHTCTHTCIHAYLHTYLFAYLLGSSEGFLS